MDSSKSPGGHIMGYRPPKGVRPPHLEGRRTGRPRGSRNHARLWADAVWGFRHRADADADADPPTPGAWLWRGFAAAYPDTLEDYLAANGRL